MATTTETATYEWYVNDSWGASRDRQTYAALALVGRNGWRSVYEPESDRWYVYGPYGGPARIYSRVR